MKELYIDFDGVILDTIKELYDMLEEEGIDRKDYEKASEFFSTVNWYQFIKEVPEINDSFNCIKKILNSNRFRVSILTHVVTLDEAIAKVDFIRKRFTDITIIPVPKKISKTKMVHTDGAILIDDFTNNLREWETEGGIGVRFSTKLNGKGFRVIDRLDKILDLDI